MRASCGGGIFKVFSQGNRTATCSGIGTLLNCFNFSFYVPNSDFHLHVIIKVPSHFPLKFLINEVASVCLSKRVVNLIEFLFNLMVSIEASW